MKVKTIIDEDLVNYKKPSMFIGTSMCDFKCCKEAGNNICQNMPLIKEKTIEVNDMTIVNRYIDNPITEAIVIGGLEPFYNIGELLNLVEAFRRKTDSDIVIYTGYRYDELEDELAALARFNNIIVKFGRYIPNQEPHYDELLGVELANKEQYAMKIS